MFRPVLKQANLAASIAKRNASSFARISILGRVGADPVEGETGSGKPFVRYSVATNPIKDGPPSWFSISVFDPKQVEFTSNYMKKGALVHVEGNISNNTFEKADGTTGYGTNIYQTRIDIVSSPMGAEAAEAAEPSE